MKSEVKKMIEENEARNRRIAGGYNPLTGEGGCGARVEKRLEWEPEAVMLPEPMVADPQFASLGSRTDYVRLRARYDFEFWAASCVSIHDKLHGGYIPFVLNRPQRRVLAVIEEDRLACRPLRLILLKARQWGGSALYYLLIYLESAMNQPNGLLLKMFNTNMTVDYLCTLHYFSISSSLISPIRVVSIWLTHIQASTISHSSS